MKKLLQQLSPLLYTLSVIIIPSCKGKTAAPSQDAISAINLKRGEIISCGAPDQQFGLVDFETSVSGKAKADFNLGVALLHSFEYDEGEKVFAKVIGDDPSCAMAYWGVAMCNYHPLWNPPTESELGKGAAAIAIAQTLEKTKREAGYIDAMALFYKDWAKQDHRTRSLLFEKAMEKVYTENPKDKEAAIFYALALDATADPTDKSFSKQKKAGSILTTLYASYPNHPGVVHYIIHTFDSPELASLALTAARKYASIAPSSAHAQHMPSHIFTRLGLWEEGIASNLASVAAAKCYAESAGIKGHWDEELHGLDYLVYSYLQRGDNMHAKEQYDYLREIKEVSPVNFKVAYAYAAIPARYTLENRLWKEAAALEISLPNAKWEKFPWQKAILHFARLVGAAHIGSLDAARIELKNLNTIHDTLTQQKNIYQANQVQVQINTGEAWIQFKEGNNAQALNLMNAAADLEEKTQKHPVTPGEVIPAREFLADMLLQMNKPTEALAAYEQDLQQHRGRFNGLLGAALAANKAGDLAKAKSYYQQLITMSDPASSNRPELISARSFIKENSK